MRGKYMLNSQITVIQIRMHNAYSQSIRRNKIIPLQRKNSVLRKSKKYFNIAK